jgi:hypothetical protein
VAHHTQIAGTAYSKQDINSNEQIFDTRSTKRKNINYVLLRVKEDINTFLPQQPTLEKFTLSSTS